jgi:hypothetical protein
MKTKVLGILALVGAAAVTGVSIVGVSGTQSNIGAAGASRSISYAYGVNQTALNSGTATATTSEITNADSGTSVLTQTLWNGSSVSYGNSSYYCSASSNNTAGGTARIRILAHIMNVTSVRAVYTVTSATTGNTNYRPSVCFYSTEDCSGTTFKNVWFGADSTTNDGIEHDYTVTTASVGLTFTPRSVAIIISYYTTAGNASATVTLKSAVISWSC